MAKRKADRMDEKTARRMHAYYLTHTAYEAADRYNVKTTAGFYKILKRYGLPSKRNITDIFDPSVAYAARAAGQ